MKSTKTTYNDITFRSWNEATFAEWLDRHKLKWTYEPCTFNEEFITSFGDMVKIRYTPDFFLPDFDIYLELKPSVGNGHLVESMKQAHKIDLLRKHLKLNILQVTRTKKFIRVLCNDGTIGKYQDFLHFIEGQR